MHSGIARRRLGTVRLTARIGATGGGEFLGSCGIRYVAHPPVAPSLVDRTGPGDVVVAPPSRPHRRQLRTGFSNSVLLGHPHDRLPGMVPLGAATRAVRASASGHARPAVRGSW
ncbi:hypothetical protein AV521_24740 [Streptomyces sp. IMTB 2501]|uniref:hypothetical protein n=1 Tax=Streptomyces sp. IMTB 2501 TaxID=1776340 RepID=UPI00096D7C3A|nr:hypothetical protein [Streptomyces sp. IMTB 2501]OLZ67561.1 hypothetical protein AV521_24740 [Streptomyces sp. IMTB 2501]